MFLGNEPTIVINKVPIIIIVIRLLFFNSFKSRPFDKHGLIAALLVGFKSSSSIKKNIITLSYSKNRQYKLYI
jgi:hypothetical protein